MKSCSRRLIGQWQCGLGPIPAPAHQELSSISRKNILALTRALPDTQDGVEIWGETGGGVPSSA